MAFNIKLVLIKPQLQEENRSLQDDVVRLKVDVEERMMSKESDLLQGQLSSDAYQVINVTS